MKAPQVFQKRQADLRIPDIDRHPDQIKENILIAVVDRILGDVDLRKSRKIDLLFFGNVFGGVSGDFFCDVFRIGMRTSPQRVHSRVGMHVAGIDSDKQDLFLFPVRRRKHNRIPSVLWVIVRGTAGI